MSHTLHRTQFIPAPMERVWRYFATPSNLNALTPPELAFETLTSPTDTMYAGQLIRYRIRLAPGVRVHWLTEIRHLREHAYFVDEQRAGPYKFWYHEHHFESQDGGVEMTDHVTYELPFGPIGRLTHSLWVSRTLNRIFDYRRAQVARQFSPPQ